MSQLNYKHLRYFYTVACEGSIVKAAKNLHLSPQTISGQLTLFEHSLGIQLFERSGKQLILNDAGKLAFNFAQDIFSLGDELKQALSADSPHQSFTFTVGIVDVIPKILASKLLEKCFELADNIKLVCKEGDFDTLLSELAVNKIDLILSDSSLPTGLPIKAYNHLLGETGITFYSGIGDAEKLKENFPQSLDQQPFLICGDKSAQKILLKSWFEEQKIHPKLVAEFDDSALMKFFGQSGYGVFCTPSTIEEHVVKQYNLEIIGRTTSVKERFYAISPERKLKHPGVKVVVGEAKKIFT